MGRKMQDHLSVAHFAAGPRSQELRWSWAQCASTVVLRFSISVPRTTVSHSRTERHLSQASQHAVGADVVQICKS